MNYKKLKLEDFKKVNIDAGAVLTLFPNLYNNLDKKFYIFINGYKEDFVILIQLTEFSNLKIDWIPNDIMKINLVENLLEIIDYANGGLSINFEVIEFFEIPLELFQSLAFGLLSNNIQIQRELGV